MQPKPYLSLLGFLFCFVSANSQQKQSVDSTLKFNGLVSPSELLNVKGIRSFRDSLGLFRKAFADPLIKAYQDPIRFNQATTDYNGISDSSYIKNSSQYYFGTLQFASNWLVADIPLSVNYQNLGWTDYDNNGISNPVVQFDRDNYLVQLKNILAAKDDLKNMLPKIAARLPI